MVSCIRLLQASNMNQLYIKLSEKVTASDEMYVERL